MKKIPSLFLKSEDDPHGIVKNIINPDCQWVLDGEGVPTAKLDGSACAVINGALYKRYDNSKRKGDDRVQNTQPLDTWIHCGDTTERGRFIYWVPVGPKDYYHLIAWGWAQGKLRDGTYELVGPEVQGNLHSLSHNKLIEHGSVPAFAFIENHPSYDQIREYLKECPWEGIVWHHPDGRMAKITKAKFGYPWG